MKTKVNMPKRTQHCDTENGKHCDTIPELGFDPSEKPPLMLLARYLGTCHTASSTVTLPKKKTLTRIVELSPKCWCKFQLIVSQVV